jgi:hypothetical protein
MTPPVFLIWLTDIKTNFTLLDRAVAHFDPRFTLRVLRSISSMRKYITPEVLAEVIVETYPDSNETASFLLEAIGQAGAFEGVQEASKMEVDSEQNKTAPKEILPEVDAYLSICAEIHCSLWGHSQDLHLLLSRQAHPWQVPCGAWSSQAGLDRDATSNGTWILAAWELGSGCSTP